MGTFNWLSWDIMEPISYLMMFGNFTAAFGWYTLYITDPHRQNPVDWFRERSKESQCRRAGIDTEKMDVLLKEVNSLREKLRHEH